jgi:hypothetical protein
MTSHVESLADFSTEARERRMRLMTWFVRVAAKLVSKDTVLVRTGETVDILLDVTNPGRWMAHCHIADAPAATDRRSETASVSESPRSEIRTLAELSVERAAPTRAHRSKIQLVAAGSVVSS